MNKQGNADSMNKTACSQYSNDTDHNPEDIMKSICLVSLKNGTPREQNCMGSVEYPHEHERAGGSQQTDKAETENSHQHADHFEQSDVF